MRLTEGQPVTGLTGKTIRLGEHHGVSTVACGSGAGSLALAQLLSGVPDFAIAVKGDTFNSLRSKAMSFFMQDDIHVVPRLLLNVGL